MTRLPGFRDLRARFPYVAEVVLIIAAYLTSTLNYVQSMDARMELDVANAFAQSHQWFLRVHYPTSPGSGAVYGTGGHVFAAHDIGASLQWMPFAWLWAHHVISWSTETCIAALYDPLWGFVLLAVFYRLQRQLRVSTKSSLRATMLVAFGSLVWPYAHLSFDVLPTAALILAGTHTLLRATTEDAPRGYLLSGAFFGGAVLFRIDSVLAVLVAAGWVLVAVRGSQRRFRDVGYWGIGPAIALAITAWYNAVRFGGIFNDGHFGDPNVAVAHNPLMGVALELLSPERGLIVTMPVVLVALLGWRSLRNSQPALAWFVFLVPLAFAAVEGRLFNWSGADAWGPRLMVSSATLLLIPLGTVLDRWPALSTITKAFVVGVSALSVLIQCVAISMVYPLAPLAISNSDGTAFSTSQLVDAIHLLFHHGQQRPWWLDYLRPRSGAGLVISFAAWILFLALTWSLVRVLSNVVRRWNRNEVPAHR